MKTRLLIMRPDQPQETREVDLPREPGFHKLRDIIAPLLGTGDFEHVSVLADFDDGDEFQPLDMFVDDTGLLKGLPRNEAATVLYRRANPMGRSAAPAVPDPEMLSFIAGTAILFDRRVWF